MGKRYEKNRNAVTENKKTLDGLRVDRDDIQKEYTPLTEISGIREVLEDEVSDAIQGVADVGTAEAERILSETDVAEHEKGEIAAEIGQQLDKLNSGLDKLRKMESFEFGKKATEKGVSDYKKQIEKFNELMEELDESVEIASITDKNGNASADIAVNINDSADAIRDQIAENQHRISDYKSLNGSSLTVKISRFFDRGISDKLPDNRGIDIMALESNSINQVPANSYNSQYDNPVLSHRLYGGVYEDSESGNQVNAFGTNDPLVNGLKYSQGNNSSGYRQTCGIAQQAGVMSLAGYSETEESMVKYNKEIGACSREYIFTPSENGGTTPRSIAAALTGKELDSHYEYDLEEEDIATLVESGRGVIAGVNAGCLWNSSSSSAFGDGGANHAIQIIGTGRDRNTNEIEGFFINDTGRGLEPDQKRWMAIDDFREAYRVKRSAIIATDQPIR